MLNHIVAKSVCKHLAGKRGDGDARRLALEDVAEVFEVGVAPANGAVFELEGGDIGAADDLVVRVHVTVGAVCLGVFDLLNREEGVSALWSLGLGTRLEEEA